MKRISHVRLRLVLEVEEFTDEEPTSLPGVTIETTAESVTEPRSVVKTTAERWPWFRAAGAK